MLLPLQRRHRSTVNSVLAASMGNESVPKIIINNTINLFLKLHAISILVISNHRGGSRG